MAKRYSQFEIDKVNKQADIRRLIPGASESKATQSLDCPFCGKKKKFKVSYNAKYNNAHCFACEKGFAGPLDAYAFYHDLDVKRNFLQVLEGCANECNIIISTEEQTQRKTVNAQKKEIANTFCHRQLAASGLSVEDVMAHVIENGQEQIKSPFMPGGMGYKFIPDMRGQDMLIFYYDLYGRPVTYTAKGLKTLRNYVRARYANPDIHVDADGKTMKYQTPPGAPAQVYIPDKIRRAFQTKTHIEVLFLQEGEKKAEKACKHGMMSMGLQGIMNIGNREQGLIQAIQDVVVACTVRHIVFLMDSDWNELSSNISTGDRADIRPISFASAVIKYKQYVETFHNLGLNYDIWWGHVNQNENGDKGVDDLLVGSLLGRESELMEDVERTMHSHDGRGQWLDIHKITAMSDAKIREFWHLNDRQAFFDAHKERLTELPTFKLGWVKYRVENDKLIAVSRYSFDTDIFCMEKDSKDNEKVSLNYIETLRFLTESGFYRWRKSEDDTSGYDFIQIDSGVIRRISPYILRDFIVQYIMTNVNIPMVREFFASKIDILLPDRKFERLEMRTENFNNFESDVQRTYYNNGQVEITSRGITHGKAMCDVWRDRIIARDFKRIEIFKHITKVGDGFSIELTDAGKNCEFLQVLINTSNNYFTHDTKRELTEDERLDWTLHIVNKITAIGYLLADWKYPSDTVAVVIQDHQISEVGQAWGGAGKSVLGKAISQITKQFFIDGKDFSPTDQFVLSGVTPSTRNIFIDDIKTNFDFEHIFNWITGDMPVNPKNDKRFTIPLAESPKILLATNHAIKGATIGSVQRRIAYVEFSSWYNNGHTIVDDFDHMMFNDWDKYQWTLFDNLMAECVMFYFRAFEDGWTNKGHGIVPPPMHNIEKRTLRQYMSEVLLQWGEEFFDPSGVNLNKRLPKKELWTAFSEYAGNPNAHGVSRTNFKKKLQAFCKYKDYDFNNDRPITLSPGNRVYYSDWKKTHPTETYIGDDDKAGGAEYFTVFSLDKDKEDKPF